MAPQSFAYQHVRGALFSVAIQWIDIERTFNFAINVLSVCKNSPAELWDVLCWSSFFLTAEKSL